MWDIIIQYCHTKSVGESMTIQEWAFSQTQALKVSAMADLSQLNSGVQDLA